jgi:cellulose synthase (UDP-forming)
LVKALTFGFWFCVALLMLLLVAQPVGHSTRLSLSLLVIAILAVIMLFRLGGVWRHVFLALASIVILQYAYWRTTSTIPPVDDLYSFVPGILLYAAEMFCILMLAISLFVIADPIEQPPAPEIDDADCPTIDVFVPSYNEEREILALTLASAAAMDYPADKFTVYLLDDGGTDAKRLSSDPDTAAKANARAADLMSLCSDLGVVYLTRAENLHAKAGNLNAALWRTTGELVVVFDADHAPERSFLRQTVGHFLTDPKLFLVQTPHFFSNPDPIERNLGTFGKMPSENEMFYGKIQKGLDRWNASFFCGSAAVLRREALEEVGGFSGITITEDCETALELHSRGWNSRYIDKPLISGLQPETLASFIGQRSRWCQGMVQILLLKNPLFKRGLSFPQRVSYLSSALFWFFPFVRAAFLIAPMLFVLFNMKIFVASFEDFIAYTVMYIIVAEMVRTYLYGNVRWPWVSELYEYVQSVYLIKAIVSVILKPKSPTFKVTAKGVSQKHDSISELALPYVVIFAVLAITLFVAAYRYNTEPEISSLLLIAGIWNWMNLVIAGAALGVVTERGQDVAGVELPVRASVEVEFGETVLKGAIINASARVGRLVPVEATTRQLRKGEYGRLRLLDPSANMLITSLPVHIGAISGTGDNSIELKFEAEAHHFPIIAELMFRDLSVVRNQRELRRRPKSLIAGSIRFIRWAVTCPLSALSIALSGTPNQPVGERKTKSVSTSPVVATAALRHREIGE